MRRPRLAPPAAFLAALLALLGLAGSACAAVPDSARSPGAALRARFEAMLPSLGDNGFGRPLALRSREAGHRVEGEVYALVDHRFAEVEQALHEPSQWCDVLVLPFNVKRCEADDAPARSRLRLFIARRKDSTPDDTYRLDFRFRDAALAPDFLRIALAAPSGPFGTHDYRIALEAAPADADRTILHLRYSYGYGLASQMAMQLYLSTVGAHNVGFTVESREPGGKPEYVRGMRGVMERNTMRYFLAIEAYLASRSAPAASREDARLKAWFEAADRYPRQLHEMDLDRYLAMKHRDLHWRQGARGLAQRS
ncbi:MAG TPA: hypothetical protein VLY46_01225 [Usitatibacter sp.]|nr:hypothetical protein [Usitatibacter sp.]